MTTHVYSSIFEHTSDATFRAWGSQLAAALSQVGLTQTSDTGQINWTTVTRASANNVAGYEIWRLSGSALYFKIEYGTDTISTYPMLYVTVGTGSNGSGTITGQTNTRNKITQNAAIVSYSVLYKTYLSCSADHFALVFKDGAAAGGYLYGLVVVGRTVDNTGAATATGFGILRTQGQGGSIAAEALKLQCVRTAATAATRTDSTDFVVIPGTPQKSKVGNDLQTYQLFMNMPDVMPFKWAVAVIYTEIMKLSTVTVASAGATPSKYLSIGKLNASYGLAGFDKLFYSIAILWE